MQSKLFLYKLYISCKSEKIGTWSDEDSFTVINSRVIVNLLLAGLIINVGSHTHCALKVWYVIAKKKCSRWYINSLAPCDFNSQPQVYN